VADVHEEWKQLLNSNNRTDKNRMNRNCLTTSNHISNPNSNVKNIPNPSPKPDITSADPDIRRSAFYLNPTIINSYKLFIVYCRKREIKLTAMSAIRTFVVPGYSQ